jgi:trehalose-phosphatase
MKCVTAAYSLDEFFARLKKAEKRALLLDYDGTLAPFRPKREDAVPYPGLRKKLNEFLEMDHTRVVIISGRPIEELIAGGRCRASCAAGCFRLLSSHHLVRSNRRQQTFCA